MPPSENFSGAEYLKAKALARHACRGWFLSPEDWAEVEQDCALAWWRSGSSTRAWWAARDSAQKIQHSRKDGKRRLPTAPLTDTKANKLTDKQQTCNEAIDNLSWIALLSQLPENDRLILIELIEKDRTQLAVAKEFNWPENKVYQRFRAAKKRVLESYEP